MSDVEHTFRSPLGDATLERVQMNDSLLSFQNPGHLEEGDFVTVISKEGTEYPGCYVQEVTHEGMVVKVGIA